MTTLPVAQYGNDEFKLVLQLIQSAFTAGYAQGQFDQAGGFNSCDSLDAVTKEWMDDHQEIFSVPVEIEKVISQLVAEANEQRNLTSI